MGITFYQQKKELAYLIETEWKYSKFFCMVTYGTPYTHEALLATYKKHIHQLWDQIFTDTPVTNTKLIVGNRNSCNATKTLMRRRPHIILSAKIT